MRLRADRDASAETCKKDPDGIFFGLKAAADISRSAVEARISWTRIRSVEKSSSSSRTFSDSSRTCRPNRTVESRSGCSHIVQPYFIQNRARKSSAPNPYLRVSISSARLKKDCERSFLHVSADSTSPPADRCLLRGTPWNSAFSRFPRRADMLKGFAFQNLPRAPRKFLLPFRIFSCKNCGFIV